MKFYPSDWRADAMLRLCSIGARGLWAEMMCIMHEATPYGSLLVNGKRIDKRQLAGLCGVSEKECLALLLELEGNGVFSRDEDGTIYSRRMRRDHEKATKDKANGKKGGNPQVKGGVNPPVNGEVKAQKPEARDQMDRIGSARASASAFTEGSMARASAFWKALGFENPLDIPPEFAGVDWRAVGWEQAGWTVEMIAAEAKRIGPEKPLSYHEKVFATAHAKLNAPLPTVEIREPETLKVTHAKPGKPTLREVADRQLQRLATFDDPAPGGLRDGESDGAVRRLSSG